MMGIELIVVNMKQKKGILESCNVKVTINIKFCSHSTYEIMRPIYGHKTTVIPPHLVSSICIYYLHQISVYENYFLNLVM